MKKLLLIALLIVGALSNNILALENYPVITDYGMPEKLKNDSTFFMPDSLSYNVPKGVNSDFHIFAVSMENYYQEIGIYNELLTNLIDFEDSLYYNIKQKLILLLDPNKFFVDIELKAISIKNTDYSLNKTNFVVSSEIYEGKSGFLPISLYSEILNLPLEIIFKPKIGLFIDNSIDLNKLSTTLIHLINNILNDYVNNDDDNTDPEIRNYKERIKFISTNIDSLKKSKGITEDIQALSKEKIYDKSYAIIIGIDEYETISDLDYAVNDAVAIKEMLINQFNYAQEDIKLLINEDANKDNIVDALSDISLLANENDRIVVFFAGHGETMSLPDGGEMGYLLPVDGRQENLYASAIPMNDLKYLSDFSKAKHMLFLVDACYGGLAAVGTRGLTPAKTPNYLEKITNIKARQIITAGGSDEKVMEKSEWGHSAYTMNLLRALKDGLADTNGDGYITAGELGLYLNEKVTIDTENQQTPQSRRLTSHEGEFIFFNNP